MANKSLQLWAAVLLLLGGLVHMIPSLYTGLESLTNGTPWIQIIVGVLSVIVALVMFAGDKQGDEEGESMSASSDSSSSDMGGSDSSGPSMSSSPGDATK